MRKEERLTCPSSDQSGVEGAECPRTTRLILATLVVGVATITPGREAASPADDKPRAGLLAYSSSRCGTFDIDCPSRVYVVRPGQRQPIVLPCSARAGGRCYEGSPAFSPSGRLLATGTLGLDDESIAIRDLTGRVKRRVSHRRGIEDLAWGGARGLLAFNDNERILIAPSSGNTKRVYRRTGGNTVAFSRQGKLAWTSDDRKGLWVTDRTRGRVRRIPIVADAPTWSPERLVNADGSGRRVLSKRCESDSLKGGLAWSGREIACGTLNGDLLAVRVSTRRTRVIARRVFADDRLATRCTSLRNRALSTEGSREPPPGARLATRAPCRPSGSARCGPNDAPPMGPSEVERLAEDPDDVEAAEFALTEYRDLRQDLVTRQPFIRAVSLTTNVATLLSVLAQEDVVTDIKGIQSLPRSAANQGASRRALLGFATTSGTVSASRRRKPPFGPPRRFAQETCVERGQLTEASSANKKTIRPNPVYFAPAILGYDTVLGPADGGRHLKHHRLAARWDENHPESLKWYCGDRLGDRTIELEARVFPDDDERWSDNWEDKDTEDTLVGTQTNLPEPLYQDDIACGKPGECSGNPFQKTRFPDFAILTAAAQRLEYRRLYRVHFETNEGETDNGRVIYNAQAGHKASTTNEQGYCGLRSGLGPFQYESCIFTKVSLCKGHAPISFGRSKHFFVDMTTQFGREWSAKRSAVAHPESWEPVSDSPQANVTCDPKPPGADRP